MFYSNEHKLTSKDKLVAAFLITCPYDNGCYLYDAKRIAASSRLAIQTVQKSVGRLEAIGYVSFVTDVHFILEFGNAE